jgi:ubiquinone/menaquinone biosynthesis C-methylase UbiE
MQVAPKETAMSTASDVRFWDRTSRKYARAAISDQAGYERTLERTRGLLRPDDEVLELGCGTGTTALRLAGDAQSYLATDISAEMLKIAGEKLAAAPVPGLAFRTATAEALASESRRFDAVLAFNYLHLVRDLPGALRSIHNLLDADGLLVSKTPCLGDMNPLLRHVLVPVMRGIGLAPHVNSLRAKDLGELMRDAGFEILAVESHATKGKDNRPFILARRR